jgi:preprotein translocase subunit Sec61beta
MDKIAALAVPAGTLLAIIGLMSMWLELDSNIDPRSVFGSAIAVMVGGGVAAWGVFARRADGESSQPRP